MRHGTTGTDIFENPVTAESVELGNRVLHWQFMESWSPTAVVYRRLREASQEDAS